APARRPGPAAVFRCRPRERARPARLLRRVLLRRLLLELEGDEALVAVHPGVVTGLDHIGVAGPDVDLGPVLVCYVNAAGLNDADVPRLAAVGARHRLDALRPLPARLEREAGGSRAVDADHVHARLLRSKRLGRPFDVSPL